MSFIKFTQSLLLLVAGLAALIATHPAQAQTEEAIKETILYNFTNANGDGRAPQAGLIADSQGNFYGTTSFGGDSGIYGTVFEISPNGNGGWNETVLYAFSGADGEAPYGPLIFDSAGNLYGTTLLGGVYNQGTVFELTPEGTSWKESVLHSFGSDRDGQNPSYNLVMDAAGNLYGTTLHEVYELSPSGGGWTISVIYYPDKAVDSGLTIDSAGNIFGTSIATVFELSPNGKGGWHKRVIHTFTGGPTDGNYAAGTPALDQAGNLYGTTAGGGLGSGEGDGTVYELSPGPNGTWTEKILYFFKGGDDANNPSGGVVLDAAGNIYGASISGGRHGDGTVFKVTAPTGKGSYREKVLWNFDGPNGSFPEGGVILDSAGNLYGTTAGGGNAKNCSGGNPIGCGVVFKMTP
jgi:uncharacterized repeat protein (TIGR03803 family)